MGGVSRALMQRLRLSSETLRRHPRFAAALLEFRRRIAIARHGVFDPMPPVPGGVFLSPSERHLADYESAALSLSWARARLADPLEWQKTARAKLIELLGVSARAAAPEAIEGETATVAPGLRRRTFYLKVHPKAHVPVSIVWVEDRAETRLPVMLCLQGHTSGAHISWGEARYPIDAQRIARGGDYALQAAARGYVAVCIEQSCFGERSERKITQRWDHPCVDAANRTLLLGRTLLGERLTDVRAVVDWLSANSPGPAIDSKRIHAMGNSAGGETALYAAALDERIVGVIASGCVGRFRTTSGARKTCPDTAVPGILRWLEYDDIVALCAPRVVLAVSGRRDHIYPFAEVEACVMGASAVYEAMNVRQNLACLPGPDGHRFYPDIAWMKFVEITNARDEKLTRGGAS